MIESISRRLLSVSLGGITVGAFVFGASLSAQDPFGDFGAPAAKQAPAAAAANADEKGAPKAAGKLAQPEAPPDPSRYSLPVRAVLEGNPQTPAELVRATSLLIDLGEPALATQYVAQLGEAGLDEQALAELVRRLGSTPFLKIAREKTLEPVGREFADRAIAAASQQARDPERLRQFVDQLGDASPEVQRRAARELLDAHEFAVPPLLAVLNDPNKRALHSRARDVLAALGDDAVAPLLTVLDGPDTNAKVTAIEVLARLQSGEATARLVGLYASPASSDAVRRAAEQALFDLHGKTPTTGEAATFLHNETEAVLSGDRLLETNADGRALVWFWDAANGVPAARSVSPEQARSHLAAQLAQRLFELSPSDPAHRRLYLTALLQAAAYRVGLDNPLPREPGSAFAAAAGMGSQAVEDALAYAMANGYAPAATIAAEVLGEIGDAGMLNRAGEPSPLAKALVHKDRRLRFAAAAAIVQLEPTGSFAGAGHLKSALVYFATSAGQRKALVAFPNGETAQRLAAMVNALGFDTATVTSGWPLQLAAARSGDYELILVSSRIDRGPLYEVWQDLRSHAHTAQTPIILLAEEDELGLLREQARDDYLTSAVLRPRGLEGMRYAVDEALRRAGDRIVPPAIRERQALAALAMIAELMESAPKAFDFRIDEKRLAPLLNLPSLGPAAAAVLAGFGTHGSQQALLAIVNRASQPMASRQAAARAFGDSVRRFGIRLTKDEILKQYERYNQSELEDRASQELLGGVLDAIELPSRIQAETVRGASR
jgi:HEAT repeat protein/DNA-binding response OmpR family regulator